MKISDGVHFINAVAADPRKQKSQDPAVKSINQHDIIELSRFKLKQLSANSKLHNYIAMREWPRVIKACSELIGDPKEFTEFRDDVVFSS